MHDEGRGATTAGKPGVDAEAVHRQLGRVLQGRAFRQAPRLSRLLTYLVEQTLDGAAERLKEYVVGVDVFDRGETFDPRTDTIVRVQVRRLRARLDEHYQADGRDDPIVIEVPTGQYAAVFSSAALRRCPPVPRRASLPSSSPPVQFQLPVPRTTLIGRDDDLAVVTALLRSQATRMVTLTGPGGSGKTRLAIEAAWKTADAFPGGVILLPLAPLTDPLGLPAALAQAIGFRNPRGQPLIDALLDHLRRSLAQPTLLLIDNFEHLLEAAPLAGRLLEASAQLGLLVTSRERLRVYGEHEHPVPPLAVPAEGAALSDLERNPAVGLFVERARAADGAFDLTSGNAPAVAGICRRLDGLPLAIELAAARAKGLDPATLARRLEDSLDVLSDGPRDLPARQRTLRAAIDWSYRLLDDGEQRLFRRLAVFAGGCTADGAEAVCDAGRDLGLDAATGLTSLIDKSLLRRGVDDDRLEMLETLRAYGLEQLRASGDETATRSAHAAYCIVLAEESGQVPSEAHWERWLRSCDVEHDNLRSALDWLLATRRVDWALRLGLALHAFWEQRELIQEAYERLQAILNLRPEGASSKSWALAASASAALAHTLGDRDTARRMFSLASELAGSLGDRRTQAQVWNSQGAFHRLCGNYPGAWEHWQRALGACRDLGDRRETAAMLSNLAGAARGLGTFPRARALLEQAQTIFGELDDQHGIAWSINHLGDIERDAGCLVQAERLYRESIDRFTRMGNPWGVARASCDLALATGERGDYAAARELLAQALRTFEAIGHTRGVARVIESFAELASREQAYDRALTLAGAATAVRRGSRAEPWPNEEVRFERALAPAWQVHDRATADALWLAGTRMSQDEAVSYALG